MALPLPLNLLLIVLLALAFDFVNGFHDAANSIATVVSTRVLSPRLAVVWAAFFNFVAFLVFGTHVATAIAKDVVKQDVLSIGMIFAGLVGAIVWDLITFWFGLPTSSSHALVGGMAGAAVAKAGGHVLVLTGLRKIGTFIVLSPFTGLAVAFILMVGVLWAVHRVKRVEFLNKVFRRLQLVSAAAFSLGHGANVGVGSTHRLTAVRWGIAGRVVWAWLLTIPASAVIAAISYAIVSLVS